MRFDKRHLSALSEESVARLRAHRRTECHRPRGSGILDPRIVLVRSAQRSAVGSPSSASAYFGRTPAVSRSYASVLLGIYSLSALADGGAVSRGLRRSSVWLHVRGLRELLRRLAWPRDAPRWSTVCFVSWAPRHSAVAGDAPSRFHGRVLSAVGRVRRGAPWFSVRASRRWGLVQSLTTEARRDRSRRRPSGTNATCAP